MKNLHETVSAMTGQAEAIDPLFPEAEPLVVIATGQSNCIRSLTPPEIRIAEGIERIACALERGK